VELGLHIAVLFRDKHHHMHAVKTRNRLMSLSRCEQGRVLLLVKAAGLQRRICLMRLLYFIEELYKTDPLPGTLLSLHCSAFLRIAALSDVVL